MNTKDNVAATGALKIVVQGADGVVKQEHEVKNLVVNAGLAYIASRMKDTTLGAMSHMSVGSGTTAAAGANTGLGSELNRVALTSTTVTANAIAYVATFGAGSGTGAITEAGLFNADTAGTMLCRTVFAVVNKEAGDTMSITWTVTIS